MSADAPAPARVPSSAVKRRLVVVGDRHSGADLVRRLFGACPGIHDLGDSGVFVEVAGRPRRYRPWTVVGLSSGRERRMLARLLARDAGEPATALPPREARLTRAYADAVATLDRLALSAGCRSWVEHTASPALQTASLERLVPRLRVVHVIRDGRDEVAAACVRADGQRRNGCRRADAGGAIDRWNRSLAAHARCFGRGGHGFVLYEDLVNDPRRELLRLAQECGLGLDADAAAEAIGAVALPAPRSDRARFRELFAADQRRRLEARLDLARYAGLAERLRRSALLSSMARADTPAPVPAAPVLDSG